MITTNTLKLFRERFNEQMKQLEDEFGVVINLGNITYSTNQFSGKIEVLERDQNAENMDINAVYYLNNCKRYGMPKELLGKEVYIDNKKFIFKGIKPNARKNCCVIENSKTHTNYVCSLQTIMDSIK